MASQPVQPTPWIWFPQHIAEGPAEVRAADGSIVCTTASDDTAQFIAEAGVAYFNTNLTPRQLDEQRAELLAALKDFADEFPGEEGLDRAMDYGLDAILVGARTAIAKAEGGAQ